MKILSLDLEQVLVFDDSGIINPENYPYNEHPEWTRPRKHYKLFWKTLNGWFDRTYLNTSVDKPSANKVMEKLGLSNYINLSHAGSKIKCFEKLAKDHLIIHIEDWKSNRGEDLDLAKKYGIHFIKVKAYREYDEDDNELLRVIEEVKKIIA